MPRDRSGIGVCVCLLSFVAPGWSQEQPKRSSDPEREERFAIGFRVRGFPLGLLEGGPVQRVTDSRDWKISTVSKASLMGIGPSLEITLGRGFMLSAELLHHGMGYVKTTEIFDGSGTTSDDLEHTATETTKASYWDIPLTVRFHPRGIGRFSTAYFSAGGTLRHARNVRTTNDDVSATTDTTSSNQVPAALSAGNLAGATVGFGIRLVDDFNIKITPEVRYTRWFGTTFSSDSTQSRRGQLEVGLALTF